MPPPATYKLQPTSFSYRMPAEWEPHEATWLSWPWCPETFPKETLSEVQDIWVQMIEALAAGEKVHLLVNDARTEEEVRKKLRVEKNVFIHQVRTEDVWIRDYGPIFVRQEDRIIMTDWIFNAWGGKWPPLERDSRIPSEIEKLTGIPRIETGLVLEGGSIDVNGKGVLMTTEQCLLNKNRNPSLSKAQIEAKLSEFLGIHHFIWLLEGITGDDTDGHVDDIARFTNKNTVFYALERNSDDPNFEPLQENLKRLKREKLTIVELPMPGEVPGVHGRAPASYTNFYIGNSVVLVPIYHHHNDKIALSLLKDAFPTREVIGIYCEKLVYGFGAIHCVTQQQPVILRPR